MPSTTDLQATESCGPHAEREVPTLPCPDATTGDLLHALADIAERAAALDTRGLEGDSVAIERVVRDSRTFLQCARELFDAIMRQDERRGALGRPDDPSADEWLDEPSSILAPPRIADLCFAGTFELKRTREALDTAREGDELLSAVEAARRKLVRAVRAILAAARAGPDAPLVPDEPREYLLADVQAALAVRRLYHEFRKTLRRPRDESREEVLGALRYAAGALAIVVSSPVYVDVRASDRALLRRLRERILAWARQPEHVARGLELLEDVRTCSDLLRGISRRQELREHDLALVAELRCKLVPGALVPPAGVDALLGLDDELDRLIELSRAAPSAAALERLAERLSALG